MAENYKHLYEQTKKMLTMYQDELIPGFRKQIEELERNQKWISVTERLPEKDVKVIALGNHGGVYVATYYGGRYWHKLNARNHMCQPTHWMPLPEPPQEVPDGQT